MFDEDLLRKLIALLESGEPEPFDTVIVPEALPGATYNDVLTKLKEFSYTGEPMDSERGQILAAAMSQWAIANDSEKYDKPLQDLVKYVAPILAHLLYAEWAEARAAYGAGEGEGAGFAAAEREYVESLREDYISREETEETEDESTARTVEEMMADETADETGEDRTFLTQQGADEFAAEEAEMKTATEMTESRSRSSLAELEMEGVEGLVEVSSVEAEEEAAALLEGEGAEFEGLKEVVVSPEEGLPFMEGEEAEIEVLVGAEVSPEEALEAAAEEEIKAAEELMAAEAAAAEKPEEVAEAKELAKVGPPGLIPGHKPSVVFEHTPDGICCLSLKIYALWLYEVAENAHNWSSWLIEVIQEVRNYTRIVKGEVRNPDGTKRILKKDEWRKFVEKIEKMIVSWRQYSQHIGSLSDRLMQSIHDKKVTCCPKCLSDNLIKDLATAHDLSEELVEAITTATYWRQWLDNMIDQTKRLTTIPVCEYLTCS